MRHTSAEIRAEYDRLDRLCGADTSEVALRISTRMSATMGRCVCRGTRPAEIVISALVLAPENDALFWDTIRHEYAHALVKLRFPRETHGHDAVWKAACREVGCTPSARSKDAAYNAALEQRRRAQANWRLRCRSCGKEWYHRRYTRVMWCVEHGQASRCTCPACKGHSFSVERLLRSQDVVR